MTEEISRTALRRDAILLTDKVALVTGGGAGIGRGVAEGLAEFGADVAIVDIDGGAAEQVADLVRRKGGRALPIVADMRDRDAVRSAIAQVVQAYGGLDILVNNVGGARPIPLINLTDAQMDRQIDLNLRSFVTASQAAARAMIAGGRQGVIINISSIEGLRAAPNYSVYAACKAAMLNFTRSAALELSEYGVRVNAIAPDLVPTEFLARAAPSLVSKAGREAQARYIPLRRPGNFDDCAGAVVFLASSMADYVTGVTLSVDGGTWASSGWTRNMAGDWRLLDD